MPYRYCLSNSLVTTLGSTVISSMVENEPLEGVSVLASNDKSKQTRTVTVNYRSVLKKHQFFKISFSYK